MDKPSSGALMADRGSLIHLIEENRPAEADAASVPQFKRYLLMLWRRKLVLAGAIVAAVLIGLIATLLTTPKYTATVRLEIARESDKVVKIDGVEPTTTAVDLEFYQTQYGLLRSRVLAEKVAEQLGLADQRDFFAKFGRKLDRRLAGDDSSARLPSAGHAQRLIIARDILLNNVVVEPIRASRLVDLSFISPDPELSARIANTWASLFIQSNLERRFQATSYARKFLEDRLEQLRTKLEESERMLVAYAAQQKIINVPLGNGETSIVAADLGSLNNELSQATADRIKAESRLHDASQRGVAPEALQNQAIATLRQKRAELAANYAQLMTKFEPGYPEAKAIASQVAELDRNIAREVARVGASLRSTYADSVNREQRLRAQVNTLKSGMLDLRRRSIQYNIYQRDVDTNRALYEGLLQRYKEIGVAGGVGTNNVSVVDAADVPERPSSPHLALNLFFSLLIGTAIGISLALLLDHMEEAIVDPSDVERQIGLPLLGTIPKSAESPIAALSDRKSSLVEAYLAVETSLEFSTDHGVPRTLTVTSSRPSEGKSTTAYALALTLARARRRVILIDGDMRSPSLHHILGVPNASGFSSYLAGRENVASLIHPTDQEGLFTMLAGPTPPNAAELLTTDRLAHLLEDELAQFDHIIIDSPPVMGLADAPLLASRVDATIFAVESHGIRAPLVRLALERLKMAHAHILGIVLTKFDASKSSLGYGYDYGYGYGNKAEA